MAMTAFLAGRRTVSKKCCKIVLVRYGLPVRAPGGNLPNAITCPAFNVHALCAEPD
jgi:hypothetical protein